MMCVLQYIIIYVYYYNLQIFCNFHLNTMIYDVLCSLFIIEFNSNVHL
jgi:hypothetical protein